MNNLSRGATYRQGGDLRGLAGEIYLDLSTCVNLFGPPPAVQEVLRELDVQRLRPHPYEAEPLFRASYAEYLAVDAALLVPGRGITEFIHILTRLLPRDRIAVATPDYTDSIRHVVNHLPPPRGEIDTVAARLERIAAGMARYDYVILSNPNNPLGLHIPVSELAEVCRMHPQSTLVVDEAYVDFLGGERQSMTSTELSNVVVLTSPNKVLGIAGIRTGAMWTRDPRLRHAVAGERLNWPLSFLDSTVAIAALQDSSWVERTRARLLANANILEDLLDRRFDGVVKGTPVHYRFVASEYPERDHEELVQSGVVVRAFGVNQPGRAPGLRITAPADDDLPKLIDALAT
ncbi:aminotransferase class I/II-fold pyridoxal phosphate-dependent enzyme [Amycolatopsis pithecellobii]|uniref:Aminotransferase class I/II-fold pyridoxal phosphate-dependent enzyme n=1 Tax=Amycolatopsis pithecellobii TaxID=664692 RepID=A0A6N7Z1T8_9PSEU|nr:aminotransferase class I/II-fold pyridoxal phosphate-dependent enzyme [Amycolatopsis pithecellobii]MTD55433.1 aminotransferase class I/II-fold pyridoxal phosphate-dependent enzyme [Amycolatopsis pithecellobii]